MEPQRPYEARVPAGARVQAVADAIVGTTNNLRDANGDCGRRGREPLMFPRTDDLLRALPELIWCGFGMLAMLLQPFVRSRQFFTVLALVGAVGGTARGVCGRGYAG